MSLSYFVLLASVIICFTQAGPALPRRRTILGPQVSQTQMILQEDYLAMESQVLHTSMQISNIVQWITKESFRVADEARATIVQTMDSVLQMENTSMASMDYEVQRCIRKLSIKEEVETIMRIMMSKVYQCTHTQSDQSVKIEKKMTMLINSAREHIIQTMDSMWLCESQTEEDVKPWSKDTNNNCLISLREEGKEINHSLPERANMLLQEAKKFDASTPSILQKCMVQSISTMSEKTTSIVQDIENCTKRQN